MSGGAVPLGPSVGVDIGGSKVLAVCLGAAGEIEAVEKLAIPPDSATDDVIAIVLAAAAAVTAAAEAPVTLPLGVGCPGMVDREGVAHFCPNLHAFDGIDLRHELARRRPAATTTIVANDATAACWAEHTTGPGRDPTTCSW